MGHVVSRGAAVDKIIGTFLKTHSVATSRGGDIKAMADARLGSLLTPIAENQSQLATAEETADQLHITLMIRDDESDLEIGAVCDEIWNTMGRPGQSLEYKLIVGTGKDAWSGGDPAKQHHLMLVLASNIRATDHPKLQTKKEAWATRIEMKGAAQAEAARPLDAADALVVSLASRQRALANAAQVALTRLKRDFKNSGMTEAQVHEVIPDMPKSHPRTTSPTPTPSPTS